MSVKHSVYCLICPIDNKIKYIGISRDLKIRYQAHLTSPIKSIKSWVLELRNINKYPIMKELESVDYANASFCEKKWIDKIESEQGGLLNIFKKGKTSKYPEIQYLTQ